ncbi:MAG TPA: hypothetical protein VMI54_10605 [Polyangiaceae bacterium]|nr:hypothetical protein [Polyangiaceae bacterium]
MKKCCLPPAAVALLVAASVQAQPGKSGSALLADLASGTVGDPGGGVSTGTALGLFEAVGLGTNGDAELTRAVAELDALTAAVADLTSDDVNLVAALPAGSDATAFQSASASMASAQTGILNCAAAVERAAGSPGTEATDSALLAYAGEITGLSPGSGDCGSVMDDFAAIDAAIVGNAAGQVEGAYLPLARVLKPGVPYERLASHFIQFSLTERLALGLIRTAYSVLGKPDALATALTTTPHDFLNQLHDQEIAFLHATDTYVTSGQPTTYDASAGGLADAVVERLEGVRAEVSTYSVSIVDNAQAFTPSVHDSNQVAVTLGDELQSTASSYYDTPDAVLRAGIPSCASAQATDGFAYVRPYGAGQGFKIGSSCSVHVARQLKRNVTAGAASSWTVRGRDATADQALPFLPRNAATLADETAADSFALAGGANGQGSGSSAFSVVPDGSDPSVVSLTIDLPNQASAPVRAADTHPFAAAGTGDVALFTRVPFGPDEPDRYALAVNDTYLAVDANGFAELAASPTWFDFRPTPDGHTELAYDGGVLYVDAQSLQGYFGETPDTSLANSVNIATGLGFAGWTVPTDVPRPAPSGSLTLYPDCLQSNGPSALATPVSSLLDGTTECSNLGWLYQEYVAVFKNEDSVARSFQFTDSALATWITAPVGDEAGGIHCFVPYAGSPDDHFDVGDVMVDSVTQSARVGPQTYTPAGWYLSIPANGSLELDCQVLDWGHNPSNLVLDEFTVEPCRPSGSGPCTVYQ